MRTMDIVCVNFGNRLEEMEREKAVTLSKKMISNTSGKEQEKYINLLKQLEIGMKKCSVRPASRF